MEKPSDVFRGYVSRTLRFLGLGIAIALAGALLASLLDFGENGRLSDLFIGLPLGIGIVFLAGGLVSLPNLIRMKARIHRYGFRVFRLDYKRVPVGANGQPMVRLSSDGESYILTVVAFVWRWSRVEEARGSEVWFAGDGRRGGVLVIPSSPNKPYWLRRIKLPPFRRSMERRAFGE